MELPVNYDSLTQTQRRKVREEYIKLQENKCCHCGQALDGQPSDEVLDADLNMELFPKHFLLHPIHLHHDHKTGFTIGALHARCNGYVFQYLGQ
jgi:hypothetical protein